MARVTEIKRIKVCTDTCENPVYLRWQGQLGTEYYLFSYDQTSTLDTESEGTFRRNFTDIEAQTSVLSVLRKTGREGLTLTAEHLTENEIQVIRKIGLSPRVEMFVSWNQAASPPEAPVFKEVLVVPGSIGSYQTVNRLHKISFEITLPEIFTISN